MCILLVISALPAQLFADYEDGDFCEYCGLYRYDDWLCDCGPHCSENADDDCYEKNHCSNCHEGVGEDKLCDDCNLCEDCQSESSEHCLWCEKHDDDTCSECQACTDCQVNLGLHCAYCGECLAQGIACNDHPFEMGEENHCENCADEFTCNDCGKCFFNDGDLFCDDCGQCISCALNNGYHCPECEEHYAGELCEECGFCEDCALAQQLHCEVCGEHVYEWCETGGEGTHCANCAEEFLCDQCSICTLCSALEFCEDCGFCEDCCRENAASEGCSCGDFCIASPDWDDHICPDCGTCFDEVEQCEYCGLCLECCEDYSECSEGMCVEDPDYDSHFCEECGQCFHDVEPCEYCLDSGVLYCTDCCADASEAEGCIHGVCMNSWEWSEHYCEECGKCFSDCEHEPNMHTHIFDSNDVCTICGVSKSGKPVIKTQPKDVSAPVSDIDNEYDYLNNNVTFTVRASGNDLSYQWYEVYDGTATALTDRQSTIYEDLTHINYTGTNTYWEYKGTNTNTLTLWVRNDNCGDQYSYYCVVSNSSGSVQSDAAVLTVEHVFKNYYYDWIPLGTVTYIEDGAVKSRYYSSSTKHYRYCQGEGCSEISELSDHRFGGWVKGAEPTVEYDGYKTRTCVDCQFTEVQVLPKGSAHVHDFTYEYGYSDAYHWGLCECGEKNLGTTDRHNFSEWKQTVDATDTTGGLEERSCTVCGYTETRETEKKGHTHVFYNWDYIIANGYIDGDSDNLPYMEPYGKRDGNYHYAYCLVDGCNAVEKTRHTWASEWIQYPNDYTDGVLYRYCGECYYEREGGTCSAGEYRIITFGCTANKPFARPDTTVKVFPNSSYPAGKYFDNIGEVTVTYSHGKPGEWVGLEFKHHEPDPSIAGDTEYWYFIMPKELSGKDWGDCWVEVEAEIYECEDHELERINQVDATCANAGYTGDLVCKVCRYVEEVGETIPKLNEHGKTRLEGKTDGDCYTRAYTGKLVCTVCKTVLERGTYGDYDHPAASITVSKEAVEATCTSKGSTEEKTCTKCGKIVQKSVSTPKAEHTWVEVPAKDPTCTGKGSLKYYECSVCGALMASDHETIVHNVAKLNVPAAGHTAGEAVIENETAATCENTGSCDEVVYCSVCGVELSRKQKTIDALGHDFGEWVQNQAPTETEKGSETRTCRRDPNHTETRDIPELGHIHDLNLVPAKEPTETKAGNKAYYICSGCEKWFEDAMATVEITDESSVIIPATGSAQPAFYSIIEGADAEWTKGSESDLLFTSDADFAKFVSVKVDGAVIGSANYEAVSGSTKITLKAAYLETLSVGTHTLTVVSNDGEATTQFTILAANNGGTTAPQTGDGTAPQTGDSTAPQTGDSTAPQTGDNTAPQTGDNTAPQTGDGTAPQTGDNTAPQTGDNSHIVLWIMMMILSLSGLVTAMFVSKKKRVPRLFK